MIIDTHGHYDDEQFDVDREMLLTNLKERGLKAIVTVGASMQTSENALALAHQYPAVYAAVGVHPDEVGELNDDALARLEEMCHDPKVVAVGEIGLDYHWDVEPREVQQKWFIRQLDLARKVGLPVNIHSRDASEDTFLIIKEHASDLTGIILTKMDGTAKGGIAVAIQSELKIPVKYIGVGETIEDLQKFDADQFVDALFNVED